MNLGDFRAVISAVISTDNTAGSPEQQLVDRAVNRGVLDLLRKTRCFVTPASLELDPDVWQYDFPMAILEVVTATIGDKPLKRWTPDGIYRLRHSSQLSGTPGYIAVQGSSLLLFHPPPGEDMTLDVLYVPRPVPLSQPSHDPQVMGFGTIPEDYHDAIELFALWRMADYDDDLSSQQGERYRQLYQARFREIRREISRMGTGKLAPFTIPGK